LNTQDYVASIVMHSMPYWQPDISSLAPCDGSLKPISQYQAYYSVVGSVYGGDGRSTVGVPDLRARAPLGVGHGPALSNYVLGQLGGAQKHTMKLTEQQMPGHTHDAGLEAGDLNKFVSTAVDSSSSQVSAALLCNSAIGGSNDPAGKYFGRSADPAVNTYANGIDANMAPDAFVDGKVDQLLFTTSFSPTKLPVTIQNTGQAQEYEAATALPVTPVHYLIALDGPYPNRPG
jgi:microcystin-dependent protein